VVDPAEYRRASYAVWDAMAPGWDERHAYFEKAARPVTDLMLERLAPREGDTILELAAGTGLVGHATALSVPGSRVIVSDFAESMVESARRRGGELGLANCEYQVVDAERIDLPDDSVDGVLCRWGYMLMPDHAAALAETRRVLRNDGRLSLAVFAGPERNPWAALPAAILVASGHMAPPGPGTPGIFALADPDRVRALLREAGFGEPRVEPVDLEFAFASAGDYWDFLLRVAGALSMVLAGLGEDERRAFRAQLDDQLAHFTSGDGIALQAVSLVVSAA
jgi:SAM-dependent methyltransferase